MNKVSSLFDILANTSSRKSKEKIIKENKDNELFVKSLTFLLDDFTVTGISKKKISKKITNRESELVIHSIEGMFNYLIKNNTGRDEDIYQIQKFIENQDSSLKEFLEGLVTKSTRLGITAKTLNKIIPDSVREFGVILAEPYSKNMNKVNGKEDFILTTKLDGVRNVAIVENGNVECFSRQGQIVEGLIEVEKELATLPNGVYDGELMAITEGIADSKEIFAETIKRSRVKGKKVGLKFVVYDYIADVNDFYKGIDKTPCIERKNTLKAIIYEKNLKFIHYLEPIYIGKEVDKICILLNEEVAKGEEGLMINLANAPYECKRVKTLLKVKQFADADVLVTDVLEGDGKNKGKLGAIEIEFEHEGNLYRCNVGSGFTDSERELYWNNKDLLLGKIVTIQYFEITPNDNGGYGMRFPVWLNRIRDDKTEISMN